MNDNTSSVKIVSLLPSPFSVGVRWHTHHKKRVKSRLPPGRIGLENGDYHFYHFSHRLPLQIATECNGMQRIAKVPDVARIELNHFPQRGLEAFRRCEWASFPSWTSRVRIPSPALENTNLAGA